MKSDILQTIDHYKQAGVERIGIYAISEKGRLKIQELDLPFGGIIRYKRLKELNERGEGIYFAPEDDYCNMLFLDDAECLDNLPHNTLVVETSPNKYQLHIPFVGQAQNKKTRTEFQRQLHQIHKADIGAVDANHLRRLPGFYNQKYTDKPIVKILHTIENGDPLTLKELMNMVKKAEKRKKTTADTKRLRRHSPPPSLTVRRFWGDFFDDGDKSRADIRYVLYLLRLGVNEDDIRTKLLQESLDISERKAGHLDDYIDRTIRRACEYIS